MFQLEVIEINDDKDDDLAKAIQLSLQDAHVSFNLFNFPGKSSNLMFFTSYCCKFSSKFVGICDD